MAELSTQSLQDVPPDKIGRFLLAWSKLSAIGGALLLLGVCLLSVYSVLGRWLFSSPVTGDVEVVQLGCALAIAACLPYAQMKNAHVIVDFFTQKAPPALRNWLDGIAALCMAAISAWLAWRSLLGAWQTAQTGETSMILGWPQWWAHLNTAPAFVLLSLTALYTAWRLLRAQPRRLSDTTHQEAI